MSPSCPSAIISRACREATRPTSASPSSRAGVSGTAPVPYGPAGGGVKSARRPQGQAGRRAGVLDDGGSHAARGILEDEHGVAAFPTSAGLYPARRPTHPRRAIITIFRISHGPVRVEAAPEHPAVVSMRCCSDGTNRRACSAIQSRPNHSLKEDPQNSSRLYGRSSVATSPPNSNRRARAGLSRVLNPAISKPTPPTPLRLISSRPARRRSLAPPRPERGSFPNNAFGRNSQGDVAAAAARGCPMCHFSMPSGQGA